MLFRSYVAGYMGNMDLNSLDPIEGAEDAHRVFTTLMNAALEAAKTGNTESITVDVSYSQGN